MEHLWAAGLRPAEAGEFTARAYFNGRIDLTGAEGVAATIAAGSEQELAAARRLLAGELARRLAGPTEAVAEVLALLEVGIDFSEEDVTFIQPAEVRGGRAGRPTRCGSCWPRADGSNICPTSRRSCSWAGRTPARAPCSTRWSGTGVRSRHRWPGPLATPCRPPSS